MKMESIITKCSSHTRRIALGKNYQSRQYIRFTSKLIDRRKKYEKAVQKAGDKTILNSMKDVLFVSKQLVPLDTGDLMKTGRLEKKGNKVSVVYGSQSVRYAFPQHEIPYFHANGREWKYVETPYLQMVEGLGSRLSDSMQRGIDKL
jgi:hypothetical protein